MGYIEAECKNCGAQLEINEEKGKGYCPHCGTLFVAEKVKEVYTQHITKNIYGREKMEADEYIANGDVFLSLEEFQKAKNAFDKAIELKPDDWRGWFGMVKVKTKNFTDYFDETHFSDLQKAHSVADDEEDKIIDQLYEQYKDTRKAVLLKKKLEQEKLDEYYNFDRQPEPQPAKSSRKGAAPVIVPNRQAAPAKRKPRGLLKFLIFIIIIIVLGGIVVGVLYGRGVFDAEAKNFIYSEVTIQGKSGVVITAYTGTLSRVTVPKRIKGKDVLVVSLNVFPSSCRSVTFPETVVQISAQVFKVPANIQYIRLLAKIPPKLIGGPLPSLAKIYVPENCLSVYKNADGWKQYKDIIEVWH